MLSVWRASETSGRLTAALRNTLYKPCSVENATRLRIEELWHNGGGPRLQPPLPQPVQLPTEAESEEDDRGSFQK